MIKGNYQIQNNNCFVASVDEYLEEDKSMRLDYSFHHPYRNESKELLNNSKSPLISLSEICTERNLSYVPAADSDATSIPFTGLANIESFTGVATQELTPVASIKSSVKRYEPRDIVFLKMRTALRKVAVMNMIERRSEKFRNKNDKRSCAYYGRSILMDREELSKILHATETPDKIAKWLRE